MPFVKQLLHGSIMAKSLKQEALIAIKQLQQLKQPGKC